MPTEEQDSALPGGEEVQEKFRTRLYLIRQPPEGGPDHDKSPSASETRICTQPDNLLSWIPEHMGDKRKRVDAPTVRPLNVVSLRTTVAQVDMLLAYAYRAAFFIILVN